MRKAVSSRPGQILKKSVINGSSGLLIATKDKPLLITDITDEKGRVMRGLLCGEIMN